MIYVVITVIYLFIKVKYELSFFYCIRVLIAFAVVLIFVFRFPLFCVDILNLIVFLTVSTSLKNVRCFHFFFESIFHCFLLKLLISAVVLSLFDLLIPVTL